MLGERSKKKNQYFNLNEIKEKYCFFLKINVFSFKGNERLIKNIENL
jgi:hypothetical protein